MALPRLARCGFPSSTQRDSGGLLCATASDGQTNESVATAIAAMRRFEMRVTTLRLAALYLNTATLLTVSGYRRRCIAGKKETLLQRRIVALDSSCKRRLANLLH